MADAQKATTQEILQGSYLSPQVVSIPSGQLANTGSDNIRRSLKSHAKKSQICNKEESWDCDDQHGKRKTSKQRACSTIDPSQRSQCHVENVQQSVKQMQTEWSASVENVSLLYGFHSLQEKSSFCGGDESVKDHPSSMPNIRKQSPEERSETVQSQSEVDIVEDVIGDELDGKSLCSHHSCIDTAETTRADNKKVSDATFGKMSCLTGISPWKLQSEHFQTEKDKDTCQLQPKCSSETVKQSMSKKPERTESSSSSLLSTSSSSSYLPVQGRTMGPEQESLSTDASNSNREGVKVDPTNMPEGIDVGGTQESHVALLQALLAEKDEVVNQISEELMTMKLMNKQLLEDQCMVIPTNKRLHKESNEAGENMLHTTMEPTAMWHHVEHLKCHLNDLQDANDSTINELTKADEEISHLRVEIAELKAKHVEELQSLKQDSDYFKNKFHRLYGNAAPNTLNDSASELLEEIQQLRNESRKLREVNHRLDEENHQLKEVLWDLKQHDKWLPTNQFRRKRGNSETTQGNRTISGTKALICKRENDTTLQTMSSLPSHLHCISPSSQLSFEYLNIEEKSSPIKSSKQANGITFDQKLKSRDDECTERSASSCSSVSIDSNNTEALLASCNDVTNAHLINSNDLHSGGSLLDLDGFSEDDMSFTSQNNPHQQFQHAQCSRSTLCKSLTSSPGFNSSCLNRKKTARSLIDKVVLPRRPFAPRDITNLKIGHLVKFSRPAGKIGKGVIKYLGRLPGRQESYLGVELEGSEVGQHNGTFQGVRYFICKLNKGVFVNFSKVIMAWE